MCIPHCCGTHAGKTLTPKVMLLVENAFIDKFGPYAGWAHNVLFVSDLASSKKYLPSNLRPDSAVDKGRKRSSKVKLEEEEEVLEEVLGNAQLEGKLAIRQNVLQSTDITQDQKSA